MRQSVDHIIDQLNEEIGRLTNARNVLLDEAAPARHRRIKRRRAMSAATRAKIGQAMKKAWLERRKK
jgi:hypothetical protein